VRSSHPAPFAKTSEATWAAGIARLEQELPGMSDEAARVAIAEQVALLDTHSGVFPEEVGFHYYGVALYEFADGVFVLNAADPTLRGAELVAIGDTPMDNVLAAVAPLVPADNESAVADLRPLLAVCVEYLHTLGVVADIDHPGFVFERPDGSSTTVNLAPLSVDDLVTQAYTGSGSLFGVDDGSPVAEAVARRSESIWWRLDSTTSTFLLSYNDVGTEADEAIAAMTAALNDGTATRVVLDMRYARGGSYNGSLHLRNALSSDPRLQPDGALWVLIGREDVSASTALASQLDVGTNAILVGQPTPARPNPTVDETTFDLPNSGITVHIPTQIVQISDAADDRDSVEPDIRVDLTSSDFFSGKDPTLEAALTGQS